MIKALTPADPKALKHIYDAHKLRQSTPAHDIPQPEILAEEDLPDIEGRVSPETLTELADGIEAGDRSNRLTAISRELFSRGINTQEVFSILVNSHGAMEVALEHRGRNDDKAITFLWRHIVLKTQDSYFDPREMFDDLDAEIEIKPEFKAKTISSGIVTNLPPRPWVLANRIMLGAVTAILATGGIGKSVYAIATGIAICLGKVITGETIRQSKRVWILNNEDDENELHRRVAATCQRFGIALDSLDGRLYINSGADTPWQVARRMDQNKTIVRTNTVEMIIEQIRDLGIGVLVVDPFVSTHTASENSNDEIQQVITIYKRIAAETGCAIVIVHHTSKSGGDSEAHAGNADSSRGASALINACRFAYTLARMSHNTADALGIDNEERRRMIRIDSAKANYALPDKEATWFRLDTVELSNGDHVGVPVPYDMNALTAEAIRSKEEAKHEKQQQRLNDIAEAFDSLGGDRVARNVLIEKLRPVWGLKESATRGHVVDCLPLRGTDPDFFPAEGDAHLSGRWRLWAEKDNPTNERSPSYVCREAISDEEHPIAGIADED
ncbi:MAG: helicase RepA family protein [Candidatus Thiodiazotropha taylori]|nr:helicase RepA family protein [Candidatus Thiodiazotropha taylori]